MQIYTIIEDAPQPCIFLASLDKLDDAKARIVDSLNNSGSTVLIATETVRRGQDYFAFHLNELGPEGPVISYWRIELAEVDGEDPVFVFEE